MSDWPTALAYGLAGAGVGALCMIADALRKIEKHLERIANRKN